MGKVAEGNEPCEYQSETSNVTDWNNYEHTINAIEKRKLVLTAEQGYIK